MGRLGNLPKGSDVRWALLWSCLVEKRKASYLKIRPCTHVEAGRKAIRMAGSVEGAAEGLDHHRLGLRFNLVPEGIATYYKLKLFDHILPLFYKI